MLIPTQTDHSKCAVIWYKVSLSTAPAQLSITDQLGIRRVLPLGVLKYLQDTPPPPTPLCQLAPWQRSDDLYGPFAAHCIRAQHHD